MTNSKRFILDININDLETLKDKNNNIFKLIDAKKNALIGSMNSEKLCDEKHDGIEEMKEIYNNLVE